MATSVKKASPKPKSFPLATYVKTNFVTLPLALTVGEALGRIRTQAKRGDIFYLYVTDDESRLVGIVSIRNLLLSADKDTLKSLVSKNVVYLSQDCDRAEAAAQFAHCRYLSLPVVTSTGKILGVVHAHDLTETFSQSQEELFEERSRSALFELLGIESEDRSTSVLRAAKGRFPWLLLNMVGGALSAFLIHHLAPNIPNAVSFLAFVPILLIICESIGMQTVSVVITKLRHSKGQVRRVGYREIRIAGWLGLASAVLVGGAILGFSGTREVAIGVGFTMVVATLLVATIALLVPVLTRRFGIDPSVSSGPVVLAIADSSTLALYLLVAYWASKLFL